MFVPSYQLVTEIKVPAPKDLPHVVDAGSPLFFPMEDGIESLSLGSHEFSRLPQQGLWFAVVGLYQKGAIPISGVKTTIQSRNKFFEHRKISYFVHPLRVKKKPLAEARPLRLPAEVLQELNSYTEEQKALQAELVWSIFSHSDAPWSFTCPTRPMKSSITSQFASPRILPSGRSYYHSGLDLRAAIGNAVRAVASGTVRFAGPMILPGNNVIIDHGAGLFSRYMHLSEIKTTEGQKIEKGQVLGLAGDSGRVQAPHLHWEMVWKGEHANPLIILDAFRAFCTPT